MVLCLITDAACNNRDYRYRMRESSHTMPQIEEIAKGIALTIFANYINFVFGT